jgi:pyruvate/2-oxoglutarate dehydrogenase complex dihydrolipoamide acyltransferase (E2) component
MPQIPIIMPQLGESIAEATIVNFLVQPGANVETDQDLLEVETNKATMTVTAPCRGCLDHFLAQINETYPVGATLGYLNASRDDAARVGFDTTHLDNTPEPTEDAATRVGTPEERQAVQPTVRGLPVPAHVKGASYMSPRLKARMTELGLHAADLAGIAGSGAGGRVTVQDFELFIASLEKHKLSPASSMRVAVADAMRRSWTRPIATVGLPAPLDALFAHRKNASFKAGPALYALRALALALAENSAPAGRLIGHKIVHPSSIDLGFAVEATDGVLVPVIGMRTKSNSRISSIPTTISFSSRTSGSFPSNPPAAPSPSSPTSAPSGSPGPPPFPCPNKPLSSAWAPPAKCRNGMNRKVNSYPPSKPFSPLASIIASSMAALPGAS